MEFKCKYCDYQTNRNYNLLRHQNAKHKCQIIENNNDNLTGQNVSPNGQNVSPNGQNVSPNGQNVSPNGQNVSLNQNICKKCNKFYMTKKNLLIHEKKCKGVDDLTCPRCMISFTTRQAKSKHMKKDNCEARSIIHARKPNPQNIDTQNIDTQNNITNNNTNNNNNITNSNNTTNNNNNNNITNNIIINNYKEERLDYVTYDKMLSFFKKNYTCPSLLTEEIHFNDNFPENNNIQYENKTLAKIKINDKLMLKDLNILAEELVKEKANKVHKFGEDYKDKICTNMELDKYDEILAILFNYAILKQPIDQYRLEINKVKELIINSKTKLTKYILDYGYD
jgi:hypothetical protein